MRNIYSIEVMASWLIAICVNFKEFFKICHDHLGEDLVDISDYKLTQPHAETCAI